MAHDSIGRVGSVGGCICPSCELSQNTEQALHEGIQTAKKHRAADPTTHANDGLINLCLHRSLDNAPTSNTLTQVELGHMPGEGCSNMQTRARSCRKGCRDLMTYCINKETLTTIPEPYQDQYQNTLPQTGTVAGVAKHLDKLKKQIN